MYAVPIKQKEEEAVLSKPDHFDGTLEEFLSTAKAIGATAVFVQTKFLEPHHFNYSIESYDESDAEEEIESQEDQDIDLTTISPTLAEFKKFLGKEYSFSMSAKGGADELNLEWFATWNDELDEELEKAQEKVDAEAQEEELYDKAKQIENIAKIKNLIEGLMNDPKFVKIRTLREKKLYATNKFPELEELEQGAYYNAVQDVIRDIRDQINVKGLRN